MKHQYSTIKLNFGMAMTILYTFSPDSNMYLRKCEFRESYHDLDTSDKFLTGIINVNCENYAKPFMAPSLSNTLNTLILVQPSELLFKKIKPMISLSKSSHYR